MPLSNEEIKLVEDAATKLADHFENVHIFVNRHYPSDGGTLRYEQGRGNWFARYGQVREWLLREEETSRIHARADNREE